MQFGRTRNWYGYALAAIRIKSVHGQEGARAPGRTGVPAAGSAVRCITPPPGLNARAGRRSGSHRAHEMSARARGPATLDAGIDSRNGSMALGTEVTIDAVDIETVGEHQGRGAVRGEAVEHRGLSSPCLGPEPMP